MRRQVIAGSVAFVMLGLWLLGAVALPDPWNVMCLVSPLVVAVWWCCVCAIGDL